MTTAPKNLSPHQISFCPSGVFIAGPVLSETPMQNELASKKLLFFPGSRVSCQHTKLYNEDPAGTLKNLVSLQKFFIACANRGYPTFLITFSTLFRFVSFSISLSRAVSVLMKSALFFSFIIGIALSAYMGN